MAFDGVAAKGTTFSLNGKSVGKVRSIDHSDLEVPTPSTTHLGSTKKTYAAGVPDGGSINVECIFDADDTGQNEVYVLWDDPDMATWTMTLSDTSALSGSGIVTSVSLTASDADEIDILSFTVKVSGDVTVSDIVATST